MARGWESKSVEAQIEGAMAQDETPRKRRLSPAEAERLRKKEGLLLSKTQISNDLKTARNERYREMLLLALSQVEQDITALEDSD